jgi:membrane-associated protease RseP (regulator of RpoE activity)
MVSEVREGSPAEKAGLKAGDIIVEVDGTAVKGNFDLIKAVNDKKEGPVNLTIVRGGSRQTISVTPEAAKDGGNFFYKGDGEDGSIAPAMPGTFKVFPRILHFPPQPRHFRGYGRTRAGLFESDPKKMNFRAGSQTGSFCLHTC